MIPVDSKERKDAPVFSGFCAYWPLAMVEVARLSKFGNDKHNPGEPLHWARDKSTDHGDCILRHQLEYDKRDEFGFYHAVAVAWRAMCQLELLLEGEKAPEPEWWKKAGGYDQDLEDLVPWGAGPAVRQWAEDVAGDKYFFWLGNKS
jgi:hypothetical protein